MDFFELRKGELIPMILKEKESVSTGSVRLDAGIKQEQDVAFFLRRAYKDHPKVMVLNDVKLTFNGESAQIDHLVIYPFGFVIIESKSIRGEVSVNSHGEWSRSYKGAWSGMASPIKQAELQMALLRNVLKENTQNLLGKLFGVVQEGFGARKFDVLCAISSDSIIDRGNAPAEIASLLVKTEFVVDALEKIFDFKKSYQILSKLADSRPAFSEHTMMGLGDFLVNYKEQHAQAKDAPDSKSDVKSVPDHRSGLLAVACKHCGVICTGSPIPGHFGYYLKCEKCDGNTGLKDVSCPLCGSADTKATKRKESYFLECRSCNGTSVLYEGS